MLQLSRAIRAQEINQVALHTAAVLEIADPEDEEKDEEEVEAQDMSDFDVDVEVEKLCSELDPDFDGRGIRKEKFLEQFSVEEFDHFDEDCDGVLDFKELRKRACILHHQAQEAQSVNHRASQVRRNCDNQEGTEAERAYLAVLDSGKSHVTLENTKIMKMANTLIQFQQSAMKEAMVTLAVYLFPLYYSTSASAPLARKLQLSLCLSFVCSHLFVLQDFSRRFRVKY